jgi:hypothetical protein
LSIAQSLGSEKGSGGKPGNMLVGSIGVIVLTAENVRIPGNWR